MKDNCDICGQPHPGCNAHNGEGDPCGRPPKRGVPVCPLHGGHAPQVRVKAAQREEEAKARVVLAKRLESAAPIAHPVQELLDLAAEMKEWKAVLRDRLDEFRLNTVDTLGTEREVAVVLLWERALDRYAKLLVDMEKLDLQAQELALDQRRAQLAQDIALDALRRAGLGASEPAFRRALVEAARARRVVEVPALVPDVGNG